jgi:hypothetical protein
MTFSLEPRIGETLKSSTHTPSKTNLCVGSPTASQGNGAYQQIIMGKDKGLYDIQSVAIHAPTDRVETPSENIPSVAVFLSSNPAMEKFGSGNEAQKILHEKEELQKSYQELRVKFEKIRAEEKELKNQASEIKDTLAFCEKSLQDVTSKHDKAVEDLEEKDELLNRANTRADKAENQISLIKDTLTSCEKSLQDVTSKHDKAVEDLEEKDELLNRANTRADEAENQISLIKDTLASCEKSLQDVTSKYDKAVEDLEEKDELLDQANNGAEEAARESKRQVKKMKKVSNDLEKRLENANALALEYEEDLDESSKALREAEGHLKNSKKECRSEKSRADRAEKQVSDLNDEIEHQKLLTEQAKEETRSIEEDFRTLKTTVHEQTATIAKLKAGKEQQDQEMEKLKLSLQALEERFSETEAAKQPATTSPELVSMITYEEPKVEQARFRRYKNASSIWKKAITLILLFTFYFNLILAIVTYGPGFYRHQQAWFKGSLQRPIVVALHIAENQSPWKYNASSHDPSLPLEIVSTVQPTISIDPEDITITVTTSANEPVPIELPFHGFYQKFSHGLTNKQKMGISGIVAAGLTWVTYHYGGTLLSHLR